MPKTMPPLPKEVTIPVYSAPQKTDRTATMAATEAFYYGAASLVWCWYAVDPEVLNGYLEPLGMKPALLGGAGAACVSFMSAASLFGVGFPDVPGGSAFEETEVNVVAYAAAREGDVPTDLSLSEFLLGADQSKNLGVYRLHVACNSAVAIAAGRALFYENKFFASYHYTAPSLNQPVAARLADPEHWSITCYDGADEQAPVIYTADIQGAGLTWVGANASEVIDLSYDHEAGRVLGSRRNFLGMHAVALLDATNAWRVQLGFGDAGTGGTPEGGAMRDDMRRLFAGRRAAALQRFDSPPVIAEAVPFYMDLG